MKTLPYLLAPLVFVLRKSVLPPAMSLSMLAADPLCWHGATRARVANEYLLATEAGLKEMPSYTFPFIVFHGADDTLTDPDGSRTLYETSQVGHVLWFVICACLFLFISCDKTAWLASLMMSVPCSPRIRPSGS